MLLKSEFLAVVLRADNMQREYDLIAYCVTILNFNIVLEAAFKQSLT
jgi:hypothetical protein